MSLKLYAHPFSSYCQKALTALYKNGTPFEFRLLAHDDPQVMSEFAAPWPIKRFPLLLDGDRPVMEASIIIEYLGSTITALCSCCPPTRTPRWKCAAWTAFSTTTFRRRNNASSSTTCAARTSTICAVLSYLEKYGTPVTLDDLADHRVVNYVSARSGRTFPFEFDSDGEVVKVTMKSVLAVNDGSVYIGAGALGHSIASSSRLVSWWPI